MFSGLQSNYGAILADPPWSFKTWSAKGMGKNPDGMVDFGKANVAERHYKTMNLDDIKAMPVADLAAKDCVLFMWAIDPMLDAALDVGAAWGFKFKTVAFYWAKTGTNDPKKFPIGTGHWTRANPEQCLLFTRGKPHRVDAGVRKLIIAQRREHSRKPDECHAGIERLVAGPYLELFGRQQRPGWDVWGNQTDKFNEEEAA